MRLQIAQAVVGSPEAGDELRISFEGEELPVNFEYSPHESFDRFVWLLKGEYPLAQSKLDAMEAQAGIEQEWLSPYLDADWEVIIGQKLRLVLVPEGNMHDWPRFTSLHKISHLEIV